VQVTISPPLFPGREKELGDTTGIGAQKQAFCAFIRFDRGLFLADVRFVDVIPRPRPRETRDVIALIPTPALKKRCTKRRGRESVRPGRPISELTSISTLRRAAGSSQLLRERLGWAGLGWREGNEPFRE